MLHVTAVFDVPETVAAIVCTPPTGTEATDGLSVIDTVPALGATVKLTGFEVPPPGEGFATVTGTVL
jgi:hypothetical protein